MLMLPEVALSFPTVSPDGEWIVFVRTVLKADSWTLTSEARR